MNTLSNCAVLVNLAIPTAAMTRTHREVTRDVLTEKHAKANAGRFVKNLLPSRRAAAVQAVLNELRTWHYVRTTVWDDCGARLLAARAYLEYLEQFGQRKRAIADAVRSHLVDPWDDMIAEARSEQGDLFDMGMMPGPNEIQARIVPRLIVLPVPQSGHLMVDLPAELLAEAREQLDQDVNNRLDASLKDVWGRVHDVLERVVDRLGSPDAIFRDSLIENARELVDLLPSLNVTGDKRLVDVTALLREKIACQEPGKLRQSPALRATVAQEAQAILAGVRAPIDLGTFAGVMV